MGKLIREMFQKCDSRKNMTIKEMQKLFEQKEFICSYQNGNPEILSVILSRDSQQRERLLQIDMVDPKLMNPYDQPLHTDLPARVQFRIELPFSIEDIALNQVGSLLHFLNQIMEFPAFILDELNGKITYRYVWIAPLSMITSSTLLTIFGMMMLNLDLFSDIIESLADGTSTFDELLLNISKIDPHRR